MNLKRILKTHATATTIFNLQNVRYSSKAAEATQNSCYKFCFFWFRRPQNSKYSTLIAYLGCCWPPVNISSLWLLFQEELGLCAELTSLKVKLSSQPLAILDDRAAQKQSCCWCHDNFLFLFFVPWSIQPVD